MMGEEMEFQKGSLSLNELIFKVKQLVFREPGISIVTVQQELQYSFPLQNLIIIMVQRKLLDVEWREEDDLIEMDCSLYPYGRNHKPTYEEIEEFGDIIGDLVLLMTETANGTIDPQVLETVRVPLSYVNSQTNDIFITNRIFKAITMGIIQAEVSGLFEIDWKLFLRSQILEYALHRLNEGKNVLASPVVVENHTEQDDYYKPTSSDVEVTSEERFMPLLHFIINNYDGKTDLQKLLSQLPQDVLKSIRDWGYPKPIYYVFDAVCYGYIDADVFPTDKNQWKITIPEFNERNPENTVVKSRNAPCFAPLVEILQKVQIISLPRLGSLYGKTLLQTVNEHGYTNMKSYALNAIFNRNVGGYFNVQTKEWTFFYLLNFRYPEVVIKLLSEKKPTNNSDVTTPSSSNQTQFAPLLRHIEAMILDSGRKTISLYTLGSLLNLNADIKRIISSRNFPQFKYLIFHLFSAGLLRGFYKDNTWELYLPDAKVPNPNDVSKYKCIIDIVAAEGQPISVGSMGARYANTLMKVWKDTYGDFKTFIMEVMAQGYVKGEFTADYRDLILTLNKKPIKTGTVSNASKVPNVSMNGGSSSLNLDSRSASSSTIGVNKMVLDDIYSLLSNLDLNSPSLTIKLKTARSNLRDIFNE
jgi:hypothetical protein